MPIRNGEGLAEYEARLRAAYERQRAQPKTVAEMSEKERASALAALSKPAPAPVVAPFGGRHIDHLSPHERQEAARQLGISHLFPSFR